MPLYKTLNPRQNDYDDDQRKVLSRFLALEARVSALYATAGASAAGTTTGGTTITNVSNTTVVGGGGTGFISLTVPLWLSAGPTIQSPPGGTLSAVDLGQSANWVLAGPTAGSTAPATFRALVNADVAGLTAAGGITALNLLTAAGLTIVAGANVTVTTAGTSITVAAATTASAAFSVVSAGWFNVFSPIGGYIQPTAGDTTWVNQSGATLSAITGGLFLQSNTAIGAATNLNLRVQTKPASAAWTATIGFQPLMRANQFPMMGMVLRDSTNSAGTSIALQDFHLLGNNGGFAVEVTNYNSVSAFGTPSVPFTESLGLINSVMWMRIRQTTGILSFEQSAEGQVWQMLTAWTTGTYLTAPNQVGFFVAARNGSISAGMALWSWQVTAQ